MIKIYVQRQVFSRQLLVCVRYCICTVISTGIVLSCGCVLLINTSIFYFATVQCSVILITVMTSSCAISNTGALSSDEKPIQSQSAKEGNNAINKSPWNCSIAKPAPVTSLEDVMSEQLAVELQLNDELDLAKSNYSLNHSLDQSGGTSMIFNFLYCTVIATYVNGAFCDYVLGIVKHLISFLLMFKKCIT